MLSEKNSAHTPDQLAQSAVNALAHEFLREQRLSRRWGIFFKFIFAVYALFFFVYLFSVGSGTGKGIYMSGGEHTAVVNVTGIIEDNGMNSAEVIMQNLRDAFANKGAVGVILNINSGGGSAVQSGMVAREIARLRQKYTEIPIYAVINDVGASGAYYIATATQDIYADPASVVGSIGVVMNGFGFVRAMDKLGVERRLHAAGKNKGMLDPFSPEKSSEVLHVNKILDEVHQQFINFVQENRGDRIVKNHPEIFSGLFWTGQQAMDLGLIDGMGSMDYVAREIIGEEKIVVYAEPENPLLQLVNGLGAALSYKHLSPVPNFLY